jgi:hypothetical protein
MDCASLQMEAILPQSCTSIAEHFEETCQAALRGPLVDIICAMTLYSNVTCLQIRGNAVNLRCMRTEMPCAKLVSINLSLLSLLHVLH